ncbi:MAG: hypothetical protein KUG82_03350, partial [Pseudomonadales bacterium]|nr:hypothetical protein [Pseudomonadales bacterium]
DVEASAPPGCFIATAANGTYQAAYLPILRNFRDHYLLPSALGTGLPVYAVAWLAQESIEPQLLFCLGFLLLALLWKVRLKIRAALAAVFGLSAAIGPL